MIFLLKLRIYDIKPKYFKAFVELTKIQIEKRYAHSKALGYFITEIGGYILLILILYLTR
jgi:hypothetical protein